MILHVHEAANDVPQSSDISTDSEHVTMTCHSIVLLPFPSLCVYIILYNTIILYYNNMYFSLTNEDQLAPACI